MSLVETLVETLVEKIIQLVRETVMESIADCPNADPWDEQAGGAAWLDNEVSMAIDLLQTIRPSAVFPDWCRCVTVPLFQEALQTLSRADLSFILCVIEMGGSSNPEFFDMRDKSKEEILAWFKDQGYVFPNRVCKVCQKEGKMMKCSVCMDAYYCSAACQKSDWKKHKKSCTKE